ncbi:MAG: hypothetical protein OXE86_00825 [Alphaproteobacteria bacterium]|nr:hypothetical protein [Alphaproteobacteria bacterium]
MSHRPKAGPGASLFDHASLLERSSSDILPDRAGMLSDRQLVEAISTGDERFDAIDLCSEVRRRRVIGALPALVHLWNRLVPFGEKRLHPVQSEILTILEEADDPDAGRILANILKRPELVGALLARTLQAAVLRRQHVDAETLCGWCEESDPRIREAAYSLAALAVRAGSRLVRQIEAGLDDRDPQVRRAARIAMAHRNNAAVRAPLLQDLEANPDRAVILALGVIADDEVAIRLGQLADRDPSFRDVVIEVLETVDSDRAPRILARLKGDSERSAGQTAAGK